MSILCIGQLVADIMVRPVKGMPAPGTTELVEDIQVVAGGCALNTACVLSKLGTPVRIAGLLGQDQPGDIVFSALQACAVETTAVVRDGRIPTSMVIVLVNATGERSFLYREGGNEHFNHQHLDPKSFSDVDIVHIGGAMKLRQLDLDVVLTHARTHGCQLSLDTDWDPHHRWASRLAPVLCELDYLFTNEEEGGMLTGLHDPYQIGRALLAAGPQVVVVKRGAQGALLITHEVERTYPGLAMPVLDTTCAGDAFVAGFLHGIQHDWPLDRTMTFANATGALCTTDISHFAVHSVAAVLDVLDTAVSGSG